MPRRTLLTEIERPNPNQELIPGEFLASRPVLIGTSSGLPFRAQGTQVALVTGEDKVHGLLIQLGRDLATNVELFSGPTAGTVIDNPFDSIVDGALVLVQQPGGQPKPIDPDRFITALEPRRRELSSQQSERACRNPDTASR